MHAVALRIAPIALALVTVGASPMPTRAAGAFLPPIPLSGNASLRIVVDPTSPIGALTYTSTSAGTLTIELFDAKGRHIGSETREVIAGERGCWNVRAIHGSAGRASYRVLLWTADGRMSTATGPVGN